jgi:FtsZ-interacting cell division protein ZipA
MARIEPISPERWCVLIVFFITVLIRARNRRERKKFLRTKKRGKHQISEQNCRKRSKGEKRKRHSRNKPTTTLHETTRKDAETAKDTVTVAVYAEAAAAAGVRKEKNPS